MTDCKLRIEPNTLVYIIKELANDTDKYKDIVSKFEEFVGLGVGTVAYESPENPDLTLPLYRAGFSGVDIASIRDTSRQLITPKLKNQMDKEQLDRDEVKVIHKQNRDKLLEILAGFFVIQVEEKGDLELMTNVLQKQYKTSRAKFKTYAQLGGNPKVFRPSDIDSRMVDMEDNDHMLDSFKLFDAGLSNPEVSENLGLDLELVQKYRRNYLRRLSNMSELLGKEDVKTSDWLYTPTA